MATTFIDYKNNKEFYISESFIQLTMYYIHLELQKPQYMFLNKQELLDDLSDKINGLRNGYIILGWDEVLNNPNEEQTMVQALQNVKIALENKGVNIPLSELKLIPTQDDTLKYILDKKPFPTAELIRAIDALIQILEGTWNSDNYYMNLNWRYFE